MKLQSIKSKRSFNTLWPDWWTYDYDMMYRCYIPQVFEPPFRWKLPSRWPKLLLNFFFYLVCVFFTERFFFFKYLAFNKTVFLRFTFISLRAFITWLELVCRTCTITNRISTIHLALLKVFHVFFYCLDFLLFWECTIYLHGSSGMAKRENIEARGMSNGNWVCGDKDMWLKFLKALLFGWNILWGKRSERWTFFWSFSFLTRSRKHKTRKWMVFLSPARSISDIFVIVRHSSES